MCASPISVGIRPATDMVDAYHICFELRAIQPGNREDDDLIMPKPDSRL